MGGMLLGAGIAFVSLVTGIFLGVVLVNYDGQTEKVSLDEAED